MQYYDTITKQWHASKATLPNSRGNTVGLRTAENELLAKHGIIEGVVDAVPEGKVHIGSWTVEVINGTAHRIPVCITEEESAAKAQAEAQEAQLAKPVQLRAIENMFMILCAAIQTEPDLTKVRKMGFQELPAYLAEAKINEQYAAGVFQVLAAYSAVFEGMSMDIPTDLLGLQTFAGYVNSYGVYYNVKWWDDCQVHPELLGGQ